MLIGLASNARLANGAETRAAHSVAPASDRQEKVSAIGGDAMFFMPVGSLGEETGPSMGPFLTVASRFRHVTLQTRVGGLFATDKSKSFPTLAGPTRFDKRIDVVPIWFGARYHFFDPYAGLYAGADLGLNLLFTSVQGQWGDGRPLSWSTKDYRLAANASVGVVVSRKLPIDIRAQVSALNAILKGERTEPTYVGVGFSAGYAFFF